MPPIWEVVVDENIMQQAINRDWFKIEKSLEQDLIGKNNIIYASGLNLWSDLIDERKVAEQISKIMNFDV